jgi:hypothetical protein
MDSAQPSPSRSTAAGAPPAPSMGVCPICRTPATGQTVECMHCHGVHHLDCWEYNGGCGKYGCASAPATEKLTDLEVPPSFWGQTEKECPACHNRIQAAALRCRHCGTVFSTARPQDTSEFAAQRAREGDRPALRRTITILLIFSILPCTAALAAIVGGIWYALNRQRLAALPAQQAALARIALFIAIGQTALLILVAALHAVFAHPGSVL